GNLGWMLPILVIFSRLGLTAYRNGVGAAEPAVKINVGAAFGAERARRESGRPSAYRAGTKWLLGLPFAGADAISGGGSVFFAIPGLEKAANLCSAKTVAQRNPARCQRITISGLTIAKALRTLGASR